jgi:tetratricopeptide (TPR) repeat protein
MLQSGHTCRNSELTLWLACALLLCSGCSSNKQPFDLSQANYAGSASCSKCHAEQLEKHAHSHHALAMQVASPSTVLGDFNDARLEHHGIQSRMFREGDRFMVQTEGPDGQLQDYRISFVFGLTPLQQYMVELPSQSDPALAGGVMATASSKPTLPRIQVLPICWDTIKKVWFYLEPPDVKEKLAPTDDLHWTGIAQRWNTMCAECHSTNYQKQFTPAEFDSLDQHTPDLVNQVQGNIGNYQSTFSEINVACEACHGPASVHVELAQKTFPGWNRQRGYGLANLKQAAENQIQSCAPCHARRGAIYPGFAAGDNYYDFYQESLLVWPVYYPDGQVLDEDYIHGSFLQSKMYHKGIRCSDCHDPHTAKVKYPGNQLCTACHQHPAAKYDSPAHHFHKSDSEGAKCVNCHMPTTTYMAVDARHDHSLRIPRPDLSLQLGTPNACTGCHLDRNNLDEELRNKLPLYQNWMQAARDGNASVKAEIERADQWCNQACDRWYGADRRVVDHWGTAIHAGQQQLPEARDLLVELLKRRGESAPAIARATALQLLSTVDPLVGNREAIAAIDDPHPLVRSAAASALLPQPNSGEAISALEKRLQDPIRTVRLAAAQQLLLFNPSQRSAAARPYFERAIDELRIGLEANNDRAGSHLSLGSLAEQLNLDQQAIQHYQTAIVVEPAVAGARKNLAALLERNLENSQSMPAATRTQLEQQVRSMRAQELDLLARDIALLANPPAPLIYQYGLALYLAGDHQTAALQLVRAAEADKLDVSYAEAAALIFERLANWDKAQSWAEEAVRRSAGGAQSNAILQRILSARRSQD